MQSLLGVEQPKQKPQTTSDDIIGSLLSGFTGQSNEPVESSQTSQSQDKNVLGSLLSGLTGQSSEPDESDQSLGMDDLLQAGMAFYQSKQSGENSMEAIMSALMAASPMGKSSHREQSASIVVSTIMNYVGNLGKLDIQLLDKKMLGSGIFLF